MAGLDPAIQLSNCCFAYFCHSRVKRGYDKEANRQSPVRLALEAAPFDFPPARRKVTPSG
jgi:hypothetical protein